MSSKDRRASIVDTAIRLFAERGFRGTTTRQLAAAVGVSEPVLYQHFKNKLELYSAILEAKAREGTELLAVTLAPYASARDDLGFFTHLAQAILTHQSEHPEFVRLLMFSALERHQLAAMFYDKQLGCFYKQTIIPYIQQRIRDGAFRNANPAAAARAFAGMVAHRGLIGVLFQDTMPPAKRKKYVNEIVRIFLQGMSCERNGTR